MIKRGFDYRYDKEQKELRLIMPEELKNHFFASIYCRGEIMDRSQGDPGIIWASLSSNFNNIQLVAPHQVHGTRVIPSSSSFALPLRTEADAVFIDSSSDAIASLRFADCCPVVIASDSPDPWMLLLHSGFAGTAKNIVGKTLTMLYEEKGKEWRKDRTWAWIGPCICMECYSRKFDDPSTQDALNFFSPDNFYIKNGLVHFDIKGEVIKQLVQCGLPYDNIYDSSDCTCCSNGLYYSYRAGDKISRIFLLGGNTTKLI
ncbi:MAG: polyphenol oxidase family protein [Synergistaceae bacterium]|nr:polyphenol oxidase family protein [Synergistaceae bacterium]